MGHGWEGVVLKWFRGKDFEFTVTGAEQVADHYRRVHPAGGGMLAATWFETRHESHVDLPLRAGAARHELRRVPRQDGGAALVAEVKAALPGPLGDDRADAFVRIACGTATPRTLAAYARKELGLPKCRVSALGYWRPEGPKTR
ncbi:SIP domain-containing protein [Streptomyces sp. HNM0645]|uniref:SIP domain-containing protein n=1 Tax=Streptomyces sp. HNM0645 TaxID=2782343 RepID=UPI0024B728F2|nr:SIP domain-containing protein [Streptomyces sp. HNM0645]MDI9883486.1 SIP domain-containing protein [Streptomyces sp. HNM0645]